MAQTYIVFLRGINVGGAGKLPMSDLRALCEGAGLARCAHLYSKRKCHLREFAR